MQTAALLCCLLALGVCAGAGALDVHIRSRDPESGQATVRTLALDPARTACIVCDMWDEHWCTSATRRVAEVAPRMNEFLNAARARGMLIIHAPSACMKAYADHPARRRAQCAPRAADLPKGIQGWNRGLPGEEGKPWPIDQSDGGCDDDPPCKQGHPWTRQIESIEIRDEDAITDSGVETWNLLAERGVDTVLVMGVHTNMCVIGRPFGLRNMVAHGKRTLLVRDLTDTMYNPRKAPHVSHFEGTRLMVAYIERYVCPTVTSSDLTGKPPFAFEGDEAKARESQP